MRGNYGHRARIVSINGSINTRSLEPMGKISRTLALAYSVQIRRVHDLEDTGRTLHFCPRVLVCPVDLIVDCTKSGMKMQK